MTAKEQWKAFYDHKYTGNTVPSPEGMEFYFETVGPNDRIPALAEKGKDWFGVDWIKDGSIGVVIPDPRVKFILEDVADWREVVQWPDLDAFDFEEAARKDGIHLVDREKKMIYMPLFTGPFERLHTLMGFENALMALITDPEECEAFFDTFMEWRLKLMEKIKEYYNPDVIMYHDDIGTQRGLFFSLDMWRHFFKPQLKKAVDKAHELGIYFEYHSCGKVEDVIPELVEIGVDAWQGQELNDISKLKSITNGKLSYHPMPDYQNLVAQYVVGQITLDDVRKITREKFEANLEGGFYYPWMPAFDDVTTTMAEEIEKLCVEYAGDPA